MDIQSPIHRKKPRSIGKTKELEDPENSKSQCNTESKSKISSNSEDFHSINSFILEQIKSENRQARLKLNK